MTAEPGSAIEPLKADHREIERVLVALETIADRIERGGEVPVRTLRSAVVFSQTFVDRCHHGKEELCLFPCLEKRGIPKEGGPIGMMLHEHQVGRDFVAKIQDALDRHEQGEKNASELSGLCSDYVAHIRQHIFKEENVLFRMGDEVMRNEDRLSSLSCYEKTEEEKVGEEKHEEMLELAKELESSGGVSES